ncbi:unnamed protein product [Leuciscus chuanchicus]
MPTDEATAKSRCLSPLLRIMGGDRQLCFTPAQLETVAKGDMFLITPVLSTLVEVSGEQKEGEGQEKKLQGEHTVSLDGHVSIGLWNYNSNLLIIQRMLLSSVQGRSPAECLRKEPEE